MQSPYLLRSFQHPEWLTNSYCLEHRETGQVLIVDAGARPEFFAVDTAAVHGILLTHDHPDHVECLSAWRDTTLYVHQVARIQADRRLGVERLSKRAEFFRGVFEIKAMLTPGHAPDHLCFAVRALGQKQWLLFSGDILFRESVGGTRSGSVAELRNSIDRLLMEFSEDTLVFPGHGPSSNLAHEKAHNPFLRAWRHGPSFPERIEYQGKTVDCLLRARDYDGDWKLWIRDQAGVEHIVAG